MSSTLQRTARVRRQRGNSTDSLLALSPRTGRASSSDTVGDTVSQNAGKRRICRRLDGGGRRTSAPLDALLPRFRRRAASARRHRIHSLLYGGSECAAPRAHCAGRTARRRPLLALFGRSRLVRLHC